MLTGVRFCRGGKPRQDMNVVAQGKHSGGSAMRLVCSTTPPEPYAHAVTTDEVMHATMRSDTPATNMCIHNKYIGRYEC